VYLPTHFREERAAVLHDFIARHPLATLVTSTQGRLRADHLPMQYIRERSPAGTLQGHVARASTLWRDVADGTEVLAIFSGANAYISPSWYPSKQATGRVVPTWNYAVVHVRGRIRFFDEAERLRVLVESLTAAQERSQSVPWRVDDAPEEYVKAELRAIVGLEIEITEIAGKLKASQNRTAADRAGVRSALQGRGADDLDELLRDADPPATGD